MPFVVKSHIDDVMLSAKAGTAKEAFAKAIEWHVDERLTDISISDDVRSFTITEFASAMASLEIENTVDAAANRDPEVCE
jgi:phosphopantetheinyl transferase (holo-ACP synthase)